MKKTYAVFIALTFLISTATAVDTQEHSQPSAGSQDTLGDVKAGKEKAAVCASCHGADGNSVMPDWPKLAGQHHEYIVASLKSYQSGDRDNQVMAGMAANLSEDDMHNLAAYFSSQPRLGGQANAETLELGERLYRSGNPESGAAGCIACHGPAGGGNPAAAYPSLWGQHAKYTEATMIQYRTGARKHLVMSDIAKKLSDEEIKALANYIQGLH